MGRERRNSLNLTVRIGILTIGLFVLFFGVTYAFLGGVLTGVKRQSIIAGNLELELLEDENNLVIQDALPMYDEVGMIQDAFSFRLINQTNIATNYVLKLEEIVGDNSLSKEDVKYGLTKDGMVSKIDLLSNIEDGVIDGGIIAGDEQVEYELRFWIRDTVVDVDSIEGKSLKYRLKLFAYKDMTDGFEIRYKNSEYTSCTDVNCALNELYEQIMVGD